MTEYLPLLNDYECIQVVIGIYVGILYDTTVYSVTCWYAGMFVAMTIYFYICRNEPDKFKIPYIGKRA